MSVVISLRVYFFRSFFICLTLGIVSFVRSFGRPSFISFVCSLCMYYLFMFSLCIQWLYLVNAFVIHVFVSLFLC